MSQFSLGTITSSLLGVFEGGAANPNNRHVKKLGFQLALLVIQKSCMLLFPEYFKISPNYSIFIILRLQLSPANFVETLPKCKVTEVFVFTTSVIALIMNTTTGAVECRV